MIATAIGISLFATICIDGALHGQPQTLCHEFQLSRHAVKGQLLPPYPDVKACERERKARIDEWLTSIAFLEPHLINERCGPAEPEGHGDDI